MDALVMTGQIILALSILVGLHEFGHLIAAKVFGMRVEKYSIGFPPKIFGFRAGETEYSLGAIPLGGFVKITGMVDESLDTENLKAEPQPWEFRAKPAWQRLIVMIGGIVVNVITGIIIFVTLTYIFGDRYLPITEAKYGIVASELAEEIGLQTGDKIIAINGKSFSRFEDISSTEVLLSSDSYYTVERNGEIIKVPIPNNLIEQLSDRRNAGAFIAPRIPFKVGSVKEGSFAEKAGLQAGDQIVGINGTEINYYHELTQALQESKGKPIDLKVNRNGEVLTLKGNVSEEGILGFAPEIMLKYATTDYTLGQAIVKGTDTAFGLVIGNIRAFGKIFRGEVSASKSISGPIGIAQMFGDTWDWYRFWSLTGLLSMVLAFMNFLPIPALDGGHVMFLMYEIVSGRTPSDKFLEAAQKVGMVILLSLMVYAIANDTFKLFTGS